MSREEEPYVQVFEQNEQIEYDMNQSNHHSDDEDNYQRYNVMGDNYLVSYTDSDAEDEDVYVSLCILWYFKILSSFFLLLTFSLLLK